MTKHWASHFMQFWQNIHSFSFQNLLDLQEEYKQKVMSIPLYPINKLIKLNTHYPRVSKLRWTILSIKEGAMNNHTQWQM